MLHIHLPVNVTFFYIDCDVGMTVLLGVNKALKSVDG